MLIYWTILLIALLLLMVGYRLNQNKKSFIFILFYVLSAIVLILFAGLRYETGTDYIAYQTMFYEYSNSKIVISEELFFKLIIKLTSLLDSTGILFFVTCAAIFIGCTYIAIWLMSPYPVFSIFLLFAGGYFFYFLNIMRQMMAASILLLAVYFIYRKRIKAFVITVITATMIHWASIAFLPVYLFGMITNKNAIIISLFLILVTISGGMEYVLIDIGNYSGRFERYTSIDHNGNSAYVSVLINIAIIVFIYLSIKCNHESIDRLIRIILMLLLISTLMALVAGTVPLADREARVFGISSVIGIPIAMKYIRNNNMRTLSKMAVGICFLLYSQINFGVLGSAGVIPYQSII